MKFTGLMKLIEEGEGLEVEFKQRFSTFEKIAKEIIAFANTSGGFIFLGVNNDKSIYGVESEKSVTELLEKTATEYCEPAVDYNIKYYEIESKEVVVMRVYESKDKPVRLQDWLPEFDIRNAHVYIRVNDKSMLASKEMIRILRAEFSGRKLVKYSLEKNERIVFDYLNKNETINVKVLGKIANISERRASRTLVKMVRANLLMIHTKENGDEYFTAAVKT